MIQSTETASRSEIEYRGRTWTLPALAQELGVPANRLRYRLRIGLSVEEAVRDQAHQGRPHRAAEPTVDDPPQDIDANASWLMLSRRSDNRSLAKMRRVLATLLERRIARNVARGAGPVLVNGDRAIVAKLREDARALEAKDVRRTIERGAAHWSTRPQVQEQEDDDE